MARFHVVTLCLVASFLSVASAARLPNPGPEPTPTYQQLFHRQDQTTGAFSAFTGTLPASISSVIATLTSGTESFTEPTPKSTYPAGAVNPSISGAPPLPEPSLNIADFPQPDAIPDADLPLSQKFLSEIDFSIVPNIPQTDGTCSGEAGANAAANNWWTCGGHTVESDITVCPDKNTWGLSYDDGPSPYTPQLLDYLEEQELKSTFFIVGSRAVYRPSIVRYEYMTGHQISVHTWSHPYLTSLSNEEVVLELAWTKYVIQQITGVTPLTMRPPFGDIDDRVRAICRQLNLTPIIWTSDSASENGKYDTNDWRIGAGEVSAASVVGNFTNILNRASTLDTGYIVLEHDLYKQSVELATEVVLPMALALEPKQTLEPIIQCLKLQPGDAYVETNRNVSGSGGIQSPGDSNPSPGASTGSMDHLDTNSNNSNGSDNGSSGALPSHAISIASALFALIAASAFLL